MEEALLLYANEVTATLWALHAWELALVRMEDDDMEYSRECAKTRKHPDGEASEEEEAMKNHMDEDGAAHSHMRSIFPPSPSRSIVGWTNHYTLRWRMADL